MGARTNLPPFPNGWYVFGIADELRRERLLARRFLGEDVVVFRTATGAICAADAYCPHLGAHFGYGGSVQGEVLRCPFHGFCFDTTGACVRTGYGSPPPPTARLRLWPLREVNGLLLVYYSDTSAAPTWDIPALDTEEWTPLRSYAFPLHDHPQETTENSVDVGHFAFIHRYRDVRTLQAPTIDGPYLSTAYAVKRDLPLLSRFFPRLTMEVHFETHIHGLGYSLVHVTLPQLGAQARLWVLPTPTEAGLLTLRLALSMRRLERANLPRWLHWAPVSLLTPLLARFILAGFAHDTRQDFPIWQHKAYIQPPALARGDGPIGKYRAWARQFYSNAPNEQPAERRDALPVGVGARSATAPHTTPPPHAV